MKHTDVISDGLCKSPCLMLVGSIQLNANAELATTTLA